MNCLSRWFDSSMYDRISHVVNAAFTHLVHEPVCGVGELLIGIHLTVPDLAQGAVQAVANQLTLQGRARVAAGATLIRSGVRRLAWPLVAVVLLALSALIGVVRTIVLGLFFLLTTLNLVDHWQWRWQTCTRTAA